MSTTRSMKLKISVPIGCFTFVFLACMTFATKRSFTTARESAETIKKSAARDYSRKIQIFLEESLILIRSYAQGDASFAEEIAASSQEIDARSKVMKDLVRKMDENMQGSKAMQTRTSEIKMAS